MCARAFPALFTKQDAELRLLIRGSVYIVRGSKDALLFDSGRVG